MGMVAVSSLAACAFSSVERPAAAVPVKTIFSARQEAPAVSDLDTGRSALNTFFKLGSREEAASAVFIPSTAQDYEEPLLAEWAASQNTRFRTTSHDFGGSRPDDLVAWVKENKPGTDYLAETTIRKWGVKPHPKDSSRKVVFISLNHKLTDLKTGKVVVNRNCVRDTNDLPREEAPTGYKLLKNDRALLKETMDNLTKACLAKAAPTA